MPRVVSLSLASVLAILCSAGCPQNEPVVVVREVNGAFSPDDDRVLVVESRYKTDDPTAPYFADGSARDYEVVLYAAAHDDLADRVELLRWDDPTFGAIEYDPVFWLPLKDRLVWYQGSEPFVPWLVDLETGAQTELALPEPLWSELWEVAAFPPGRDHAIPSPDQETLAVFTTTRTQSGFVLVVSFFDADDGAHLSSRTLEWPAPNIDPFLVTPDGAAHHLLWAKDSSGVYALDCDAAFFVPVDEAAPVASVDEVPGFGVPTRGGPVSDAGERIFVEAEDNDAVVVLRPWGEWPVYGAEPPLEWTPFDDVTLAPLSEITYCQPR